MKREVTWMAGLLLLGSAAQAQDNNGQDAADNTVKPVWAQDSGTTDPAAAPAGASQPASTQPAEGGGNAAPVAPPPAAEIAVSEGDKPTAPKIPVKEATELDEVVVTAQRREQREVDVPINISTMSGEEVQKARIEQVRDIQAYLPNVDIKEQVPGAIPVVSIRGVSLDDFSTTNSPAAGIYVDQITLSSLALMSFDLYDIERIEVLKGPQGTLYGRNSTAGAINVLSAQPVMNREAYLRGGYGDYKTADVEGMYNQPIGDLFGLRFAGKYTHQGEGFWQSRLSQDVAYSGSGANYSSSAPIVRTIGKREVAQGRVRGGWDITNQLLLDLKVEGVKQHSEMGKPEAWGALCSSGHQPIDPQNCTDATMYHDTDNDPYKGDWRGKFPYIIHELNETMLVDWNLGWATLSSVTGNIDFRRNFHIDVDGGPADQFEFFQWDTVRQQTQELRLAGSHGIADWLVGGFYSKDHVVVYDDGKHQDLIPGEASTINADQQTHSDALFGNVDWKVIDKVSVTTGLRYTDEGRDYVGGTTWTVPIPNTIASTHEDSSISDTNWSYKLGVNYAPGSASLLYANTSRGVKSGGYFCGVTTDNSQLKPYKPETLTAYEIGGKMAGLVSLNGSVFYYKYKDVQTFIRNASAPVQFIGNVPEARTYGAELESTIRWIDNLTIRAGAGYLNSRLGSFTGPSGTPIPSGNKLPNAPSTTFNLLARYEIPLFATGYATALQADAHYASEMFKEATNDPLIKSDPYTIFNARASFLPAARNWELGLWGKNLTDKLYVVQGLDVSSLFFGNRNYNAPRTFGADVNYRF